MRPLVLGNGRLLVALDDRYRIRELTWPHVGLYNHLSGNSIRMGVWTGGAFGWVDGDGWERSLGYAPGSLAGRSLLSNAALGVRIECEDAVDPSSDLYVRRMLLSNSTALPMDLRLFLSQDPNIMESDIGDTALYNSDLRGVVHYKGAHWFLFGGRTAPGGIAQYATGLSSFGDHEGTWRDAEDGELGMNPIAQGSVDSTLALHLSLPAGGRAEAQYWIVCGDGLDSLTEGFETLKRAGVKAVVQRTTEHWRGWSAPLMERLEGLPEEVSALARLSLLVVRAHVDDEGGILAANDSDIMETNRATYSYVWPRDGALVAEVLDQVGHHEEPARFFRFCARLIGPRQPFFLQKYRADGTFGASWHAWVAHGKPETPMQEDETALVLHALGAHMDETGDLDLLRELYEPMVVPASDWLVRHRNAKTGLPLPSYDLWEERRGVHTFTTAAVVAGLRAAAKLAMAIGDDRTMGYALAAEEVYSAMRAKLVDRSTGAYLRGLVQPTPRKLAPDPTADASLLLIAILGVVDADDEAMAKTVAMIEERLVVRSPVGGIARYEGDHYFRRSEDYPGNPWIICTLWLAQYQCLIARTVEDLARPTALLKWAARWASPSGVLPEQLHPETGGPLSVSPLTWSHSEFLKTANMVADRKREIETGVGWRDRVILPEADSGPEEVQEDSATESAERAEVVP